MKAIWKFELELQGDQLIHMPVDAEIISYQSQNGRIVIWIVVDIWQKMTEPRKFRLIGTGQPFEDFGGSYIGSAQNNGFVWHLYEIRI